MMKAQEIFKKSIETLADQYELWQDHFINENEWVERRDMTYILIESLTGINREESCKAIAKEVESRKNSNKK